MSLIYEHNLEVSVNINVRADDSIDLLFGANAGKFGTDEEIAQFHMRPSELLEALNDYYGDEDE